jgi:hypothetical protein
MLDLKGMTWNLGGFGDPGKHLFVQESIREHRLDFIALLETGRSNFTVPFLKHLAAGKKISLVLSTTPWAVWRYPCGY